MSEFNRQEKLFLAYTAMYEIHSRSYVLDDKWDRLAYQLEPSLKEKIDDYNPSTGMWIHNVSPNDYEEAMEVLIKYGTEV